MGLVIHFISTDTLPDILLTLPKDTRVSVTNNDSNAA